MDTNPTRKDIVTQLNSDIEQLKTELHQEKTRREEMETHYETLKNQYDQAIDYIKQTRRAASSQGNGCLFFILLITILIFVIIYLLSITGQSGLSVGQ